MAKFDYRVGGYPEDISIEDEQADLIRIGALGWELVSVVMREVKGTRYAYYYWKREVQNAKVNGANAPKEETYERPHDSK